MREDLANYRWGLRRDLRIWSKVQASESARGVGQFRPWDFCESRRNSFRADRCTIVDSWVLARWCGFSGGHPTVKVGQGSPQQTSVFDDAELVLAVVIISIVVRGWETAQGMLGTRHDVDAHFFGRSHVFVPSNVAVHQ